MWAVIIASVMVFIGFFIYRYADYKQHPEIYMINSAPWYTDLLLQGIVTLVIIAICLIIIVVIKRKVK